MELKPKQRQAIALMVEEGMSYIEVATAIGVSRVTIWRWLDDETFCNELRTQLNKKINAIAHKANATILDLMDNAQSEKVRLDAAKELSHLSGLIPVEKTETKIEGEGFSIEIIEPEKDEKK